MDESLDIDINLCNWCAKHLLDRELDRAHNVVCYL